MSRRRRRRRNPDASSGLVTFGLAATAVIVVLYAAKRLSGSPQLAPR
jgi:preprotein translocase subunit Sec61beta